MTKTKSMKSLNNSTRASSNRESPHVAAVLKQLGQKGYAQADLARKADINRGVLNQLWQSKTRSTPNLIGRLCAVLDRDGAHQLLMAYFQDIAAAVWEEQKLAPVEHSTGDRFGDRPVKLALVYPPGVGT